MCCCLVQAADQPATKHSDRTARHRDCHASSTTANDLHHLHSEDQHFPAWREFKPHFWREGSQCNKRSALFHALPTNGPNKGEIRCIKPSTNKPLSRNLSRNLSRCFRGHTFHFCGHVFCHDHFRGAFAVVVLCKHALSRRLRGGLFFNFFRRQLSRAFAPCVLAFARLC